MLERGLLLVKPDYVDHLLVVENVVGELINRRKMPLKLVHVKKYSWMPRDLVTELYKPNKEAPHYDTVIDYWSGSSFGVILLEGDEDIFKNTLDLAGRNTDPYECNDLEIRGVLKHLIPEVYKTDPNERKLRNIVHRSDSIENWIREMGLLRGFLI